MCERNELEAVTPIIFVVCGLTLSLIGRRTINIPERIETAHTSVSCIVNSWGKSQVKDQTLIHTTRSLRKMVNV